VSDGDNVDQARVFAQQIQWEKLTWTGRVIFTALVFRRVVLCILRADAFELIPYWVGQLDHWVERKVSRIAKWVISGKQ
jgi:hypothetical protein